MKNKKKMERMKIMMTGKERNEGKKKREKIIQRRSG